MSRIICDFQTAVIHKQQHLQLAQPVLGAYRGGSLPNVNQTVDLQVGIVTFVSKVIFCELSYLPHHNIRSTLSHYGEEMIKWCLLASQDHPI